MICYQLIKDWTIIRIKNNKLFIIGILDNKIIMEEILDNNEIYNEYILIFTKRLELGYNYIYKLYYYDKFEPTNYNRTLYNWKFVKDNYSINNNLPIFNGKNYSCFFSGK